MGQLFALSFDTAASPAISFANSADQDNSPLFGWGFAWYPSNENSAMVVKDATSPFNNSLTRVLQDWRHFHSAHFICHLRGAAKFISQTGTQPFVRSLAGRDFILVHDGNMNIHPLRNLYHQDPVFFEPMGKTDSELAFCILLNKLHEKKARRLSDFGFHELNLLLNTFSSFGTSNFILADGKDMILFHGLEHPHDLYWTRRKPPHFETILDGDNLHLDLSDPLDLNRTVIIASTCPLSKADWQTLSPGQLLVARRGKIVWSSLENHKDYQNSVDKNLESTNSPSIFPISNAPDISSEIVSVIHETTYRYSKAVENSTHLLRLQPVQDSLQELLDFECEITPHFVKKSENIYFEDVFGNQSIFFNVDEPYEEIKIVSRSRVKIYTPSFMDFKADIRRATIPLMWMPWQRQMMMSYLLPPELPETQLMALSNYAMGFVERNDYDLFETLCDINSTIYQDLTYAPGYTTLKSTPFEVFINRQGVCQDFANLMICLARLLNIPARYRVGYIDTGKNYENTIQSDASHAWVELYLPYVGWRGFDPTNNCLVSLDHVRIACGRNYRDATPTSGTIYKGGENENLSVRVKVEKLS